MHKKSACFEPIVQKSACLHENVADFCVCVCFLPTEKSSSVIMGDESFEAGNFIDDDALRSLNMPEVHGDQDNSEIHSQSNNEDNDAVNKKDDGVHAENQRDIGTDNEAVSNDVETAPDKSVNKSADKSAGKDKLLAINLAENQRDIGTDNEAVSNDVETAPDKSVNKSADKSTDKDKLLAINLADKSNMQADNNKDAVFTIREYMKKMNTRRLTKIQNTNPALHFIRPRSRVPAKGKPTLYFVDGVQCQNDPRLLCSGRIFTLQEKDVKTVFVVIGCIWVRIIYLYAYVFLYLYASYVLYFCRSARATTEVASFPRQNLCMCC